MKAIMFPGQGAQFKGMGKELFKVYPSETLLASEILGYDLEELCIDNPERKLGLTQYTQPALFVVNALGFYKQQKLVSPDYFIGHSLGEYNALHAANAFDFETGLKLVIKRGDLMSKSSGGTMAAVLGIDIKELKKKIELSQYSDLDIANYNTFYQTVVSGPKESILKLAKEYGDQKIKVVPLNVSAPFHSRYMEPAAKEFRNYLEEFDFSPTTTPVISNVTAQPYNNNQIKGLLGQQIMGSVQWTSSIIWLFNNNVTDFDEIGGGDILAKMVNQIKSVYDDSEKHNNVSIPKDTLENNKSDQSLAMKLGSNSFRQDYRLDYAYLVGSMHLGITSKELVVKLAKSKMLGFLSTKGVLLEKVESDIKWIKSQLHKGVCFGVNLFYDCKPKETEELISLYLKLQVNVIEVSGFQNITSELALYRLKGLTISEAGDIHCANKIIAKVTRPEVAALFMKPAPEYIVNQLLEQKKITAQQAELSQKIPMSHDICAQADSGWNTDRQLPSILLPSIQSLRDEIQKNKHYGNTIRIGLAGGIGTPQAVANAFLMGADFILTGSINQCTVEAATSELVKNLLQSINVQDTDYIPSSDFLEFGQQSQVLRKGVMFPSRVNKLYDLYEKYDDINHIPNNTITKLKQNYFGKNLDTKWTEIFEKSNSQDRHIIVEDGNESEISMEHILKYYIELTCSLALEGEKEYQENFQIHTGPSLGAFNQWVKNTSIENWQQRHVDEIGIKMMNDAIKILEDAQQLCYN